MATFIVVEDLAGPAGRGRGGQTLHTLQWLHGLKRLGHDALFAEFCDKDSGHERAAMTRYFADVMETWWEPEWSCLMLEASCEVLCGLDATRVARVAERAAAVITIGAQYRRDPFWLVENVRPRILVEQDPGYTHLWAAGQDPAKVFGEHDVYFTVGTNVGTPRCALPTSGIAWRPVWYPIVLDWWEPGRPVTRDRFTTIADWRGYGYLEFEGRLLGPKAEEFRKFLDLPRLAGEPLELALNIDPDDPDAEYLRGHGWRLEGVEVAATPALFRDYLSGSAGEFSCAKGGYVGTRSGWFSDRSAGYLAAGRPVVLQDTGFGDLLPTGRGLFSVATAEEAAEAIREIRRDYARHAAAARALAEEFFDSDKVVRRLLSEAGLGGA